MDDFYFLEQEDPEEVLRIIIQLAKDRIPKWFGLDALDDIQVLTPMHKGVVGAGNLNVELQKVLNPGEVEVTRGGKNSNYLKLLTFWLIKHKILFIFCLKKIS